MKLPKFTHSLYLSIVVTLAMLSTLPSAMTQTMQFENVQTHNSAFYPQYFFTQQGIPVQGPYAFAFYSFRFSVKNATGDASFLNGNDYIGFCVNTMFPDPQTNDVNTFSPTPDMLTYNLGTGDYWAADRTIKFEAISNTLAYYSGQLGTLDPDGQSYAELVTGINMAFTEVIVDYDGSLASIDLNAGNSTAAVNADGDPITSGVPFSVYNYIRSNLIGTGDGGGFEVFTANAPNDSSQDLVFIKAVPEPHTAALVGLGIAGMLAFRRNRRD